MENKKRLPSSGACCRDEAKMVRCAVAALEQMKNMFGAALGTIADNDQANCAPPSQRENSRCGHHCLMNAKCQIAGCPFRVTGLPTNALRELCKKEKKSGKRNGRSDRTAMQLLPGEVGLRGDRATFHLGRGQNNANNQAITPGDVNRPTGAVYYNMPMTLPEKGLSKAETEQLRRKYVMQMLPAVPVTTQPDVGPVTGLPIGEEEHVFVLRLAKQYDEPDEKSRLQVEVRVPKVEKPVLVENGTQFLNTDISPPAKAKKSKNNKKKGGGKKGGKKKGKK